MLDEKKSKALDTIHKKYDRLMTDKVSFQKSSKKLSVISACLIELVAAFTNYALVENSRRIAHINDPETQTNINWFLFGFIGNQRVSLMYYERPKTGFDWSVMNEDNYVQVIHQFWREYPQYRGKHQGIIDYANEGVNEILNDYEHYSLGQSAIDVAPFTILGTVATVAFTYAYPYYKNKKELEKTRKEISKLEDELFWDK